MVNSNAKVTLNSMHVTNYLSDDFV